jgi:hypothetical protein
MHFMPAARMREKPLSVFTTTILAGQVSLHARMSVPARPNGWVIVAYSRRYSRIGHGSYG